MSFLATWRRKGKGKGREEREEALQNEGTLLMGDIAWERRERGKNGGVNASKDKKGKVKKGSKK